MAGFDRSKFIKANEESGSGDFFKPDPGFYMMELLAAQTGNSQGGKFQVSFKWEIAQDDEKYPGKVAWHYVQLEGENPEFGYNTLNQIVNRLKYPHDPETFASNPDAALEMLVGSKVRMQIKASKNPDFPKFFIQKLLESPVEGIAKEAYENTSPEDTDLLAPTPEVGDEDIVEIGDELSVTLPKGQFSGIVQQVIEATSQVIVKLNPPHNDVIVAEITQIAMLRKAAKIKADEAAKKNTDVSKAPTATLKTTKAAPAAEVVETVEEIVDLPEETEEIKLEVGMMVEGKYKNDKIVGKIHEIAPNNIIKIVMNRKAYPCLRETVKLV